jgi:hypothetical protein
MGLEKKALDTAPVTGKTQPLRRQRQHPSACANGSPDHTRGTTDHEVGDDAEPPPLLSGH